MTEKEKMQKQMLYDANNDRDLLDERAKAKDLCHDFNQLRPSDAEGQQKLMRQLLGKTKGAFCIVAPFWCDYGYNIEIGENFFANHNTVILDGAKVRFGDNVFIAPDCGFHTAGHPIDFERRNQGLEYAYPITIGDNVWIGAGVQVMPGGADRQQCCHRWWKCCCKGHSGQFCGRWQSVQSYPCHHGRG